MKKILIVEDDILLNKTLSFNLTADGYETVQAYSYYSGINLFTKDEFSLVLLDINLPDGNGLDLCREIKKHNKESYVVFLTANDQECDQLKGYEAGGFDYITKPFSLAVLSRKINAMIQSRGQLMPGHDIFDDGRLFIDFSSQEAFLSGEPVELTPKEYRTLYLFVKNPRMIMTKRQLLERLWDADGDFVDEHTLTTTISRIRKKIETDNYKYIKTSYGMGYQWMGGGL